MMCKYVVVKEERRAYLSVLGAFDDELRSIRQLKWRMISIGSDGDDGDDHVPKDSPLAKVRGGGSNYLGAHINGGATIRRCPSAYIVFVHEAQRRLACSSLRERRKQERKQKIEEREEEDAAQLSVVLLPVTTYAPEREGVHACMCACHTHVFACGKAVAMYNVRTR